MVEIIDDPTPDEVLAYAAGMASAGMSRYRTVVLDNEAVEALLDIRHRKHHRALSAVELVAKKATRHAPKARLVVPTAVRVEAGWDRTTPVAAVLNRLRVQDVHPDRTAADQAAVMSTELRVSVADAHLAAVLAEAVRPVAVTVVPL